MTSAKKVLLTSVCRPLGPEYGDAPSVGYELLYRQVTRAQGLFSPRALHLNFSLEYVAQNISVPAVVLQYPTRKELIRELIKGYDYIGITFMLALFHRLKETVELVRRYSPGTKIVLGGYGTILDDAVLAPYSDHICREEGVNFFRKLLDEPVIEPPFRHPLLVSRMKIFSMPVSATGMIFAGLGCPNGCDFCCTSHFFKRRHIRLLPTGKDIYDVIERYLELDPKMQFVVLDEDFLLNKKRALELRDAVLKGGKAVSLFVFSSIKAISQYKVEEILEMGIDGFWIGYEGGGSGYAKQQGRNVSEIFREFRQNGITILASMVIGFDYQNDEVVQKELDGLMELRPTLTQFLIYGPTPGTPFYDNVMKENRLRDDLAAEPEAYYRVCDGFTAMVKHPKLSAAHIENMQRACFKQDFERLGPSIYRALETWFLGYQTHRGSPNAFLRKKAEKFALEIRKAYPIFLAGTLLAPNRAIRSAVRDLRDRVHAELGAPTLTERLLSLGALGAAVWTWFTLRLGVFQHPSLTRHDYRMPERTLPAMETFHKLSLSFQRISYKKMIWVKMDGAIDSMNVERLCASIQGALHQGREKFLLDLKNLKGFEEKSVQVFCDRLKNYRKRINLIPPDFADAPLRGWLENLRFSSRPSPARD